MPYKYRELSDEERKQLERLQNVPFTLRTREQVRKIHSLIGYEDPDDKGADNEKT